jgi:Tfp pilus assembly protein PilF
LAYKPGDTNLLVDHGVCLWHEGKKKRAAEDFARAVEIDSENERARHWLDKARGK